MWLQWLWYSLAVLTSLACLCLGHVYLEGTKTVIGQRVGAACFCLFILAVVNFLVIAGFIGWSLYWEAVAIKGLLE